MKKFLWLLLLLLPLQLLAQGKRPLVWVIDAGHGGHDHGTKGRNITEKEINLKVAQEVVRLIRANKPGIKVITTRNRDVFVSLSDRCRIANRAGADLFLSIHVNWVRNKQHCGTETFYARNNLVRGRNRNAGKSELLARLLQNSYAANGRPTYRGVRTNRLYVTSNTNMPAALTEIGFISNSREADYITSEKGMKETARMIFNALMEYYATTQARTHLNTLSTLRRTNDRKSGVKNAFHIAVKSGKAAKTQSEAVPEEPVETSKAKAGAKAEVKKQEESAPREKKAETTAAKPVFSIQILSCAAEMKQTDRRLKGLSPVTFVKDGNTFRCLYAGSTNYRQVKQKLKLVRKKFPDAFIVAYLGEKSISTADALQMINQQK